MPAPPFGEGTAETTFRVTRDLDKIDATKMQAIASRWLDALTDGSREVVTLVDGDGNVRFSSFNGALQGLVGYDLVELRGLTTQDLVHPDDEVRVIAALRELTAEPNARRTVDYRVRHRSGQWLRVQSTGSNRLHDPVVEAIVIHTRELVSSEAPGLSSDPAQRAFAEAVSEALERRRRDASHDFSVLILELDRYKMLVGSYGQDAAEQMMDEASQRLRGLLAPADTIVKLGGGEIGVLLSGVGDRTQASRVADRIQKVLALRYRVADQQISTAAIVGIATTERSYDRAEQIIRDASLAATRARAPGRRRRAVFQTQMRVEDTRYMSILAGLHNALQGNHFRLHYQPIVSLATQRLAGFEALIRWYHPEQGIVSPVHFIPVAEETGLIVPIGWWAMREACRQMAAWNRLAAPDDEPLYVSVNLSAKQFVEEDIGEQIEAALADSGIDPHQLRLEITESTVLENQEAATRTLEQIKARGVRVSLDDFGTGYSSFSYLHQLPYDTLKIDRSFVSRLGVAGENSEIIHAIIVLAHNLRMDVVAEGVETPLQAEKLRKMWCEYAQGCYFAKPLDAEAAGKLIGNVTWW